LDWISESTILNFGYGLDMEFMKKFRIQTDFKISISVHYWCVLIQLHTCACNMCIIFSMVIHWQFRRIDQNSSHKPVSACSPSNCVYDSQMLSSRCILNMKHLVTLKHKQRKTSNASQESDLEACQWFHGITMIGTNIENKAFRI